MHVELVKELAYLEFIVHTPWIREYVLLSRMRYDASFMAKQGHQMAWVTASPFLLEQQESGQDSLLQHHGCKRRRHVFSKFTVYGRECGTRLHGSMIL